MKRSSLLSFCLAAGVSAAAGMDDWLDRVDDALTLSADHDLLRARVSGSLDLEGYAFNRAAPGLIYSDKSSLFNPRLTLFLDSQFGAHFYFFAQARADRGFDPAEDGSQLRLDEYALRLTPGRRGHFNLQLGKFATVVGNWVPRHHSWDNPFVTAPLPYENLTGIFDRIAATTPDALLRWSHVKPNPYNASEKFRVPVIWGPSYASGVAIMGEAGRVSYALEVKNASLSSQPETWGVAQTQWQQPTFSGRLGYRPDARWDFGFSASTGTYLRPSARPTLAAGQALGDYREIVLGQDVSYAWHHFQFWAEFYETRFTIPRVGDARTFAYYLEAKYKFTPQFFAALRWNQQLFGSIADGAGGRVQWGHNVWRADLAPSYRFTPHTQLKLQYSLQHDDLGPVEYTRLYALQFAVRF